MQALCPTSRNKQQGSITCSMPCKLGSGVISMLMESNGHSGMAKIIALMAGSEAECEIIGSCAGGDAHDRRQCDSIAGDLEYRDDWPRRAARLRRFSRQLIRRHRS